MDLGDALIRGTVRVAVLLYAASLLLRLLARGRPPWLIAARLAWGVGFVAFLAHLVCAFEFVHHWSHAAAVADTARQTGEVVGWHWGGGVWVNHAFALVWGADVIWWNASPRGYLRRGVWVEALVQGFLAFIVLNATLIFAAGFIRYATLGGLAAALLLIARSRTGRSPSPTV